MSRANLESLATKAGLSVLQVPYMDEWNETRLRSYIDDRVEESLTLDYKAAESLGSSDGKKKEITKDVSAMANSAGGLIIYGIREYKDPTKEHLAELLDPVDRTQFSKEWLEQIINNIRPKIENLIIHSVTLSGNNNVAYVIEIPQSTTAHQATDHRYYKRFNFLSQPMEDYEIRDIMNRARRPDMSVEFDYKRQHIESSEHHYLLKIKLKNLSEQVINNYQLQFTFPTYNNNVNNIVAYLDNATVRPTSKNELLFTYDSKTVCFPNQVIDLGQEMAITYRIDSQIYADSLIGYGRGPTIKWTLYADNMTPKRGTKAFEELQCF